MIRLFSVDDPRHAHASEVLPWYVNGTLMPAEHAEVERHVAECPACRAELASMQELEAIVRSESSDVAVGESLSRMHIRLAREEEASGTRRGWFSRQWRLTPSVARVALAAQCAAVVALIALAGLQYETQQDLRQRARADYRTLAATPSAAAGARLTVVFDDATTQRELKQMLQSLHAQVVDGPNTAGAYSILVPENEVGAALGQLRASPRVRLAEPAPRSGEPSRAPGGSATPPDPQIGR